MKLSVILVCFLIHSVTSLTSPPAITKPEKKTTDIVERQSTVILECHATGDPTPVYKWTFDDVEIEDSKYVSVNPTTGTLNITGFTANDVGDYQCFAENDIGNGETAVAMSPIVTLLTTVFGGDWPDETQTQTTWNEGDYVRLTCGNKPESVPTALYSWYLAQGEQSEGEVQTDDRVYVDEEGSLHFVYVMKSDEKQTLRYKCGLYNSMLDMIKLGSQKEVLVNAAVNGIPQIPAKKQFVSSNPRVLMTKDAELECVFSGNPIPTITWFKYEDEISSNDKYTIDDDSYGKKLIIKNVEESDEGTYYCRGDNGVGVTDKLPIFLDVTSGPIWVKSLSSQTVVEGRDAVFTCHARQAVGDMPLSQPEWFRNAEDMPTQNTGKYEFSDAGKILTVRSVQKPSDITCFQCKVSNDQGYEYADGCLNVVEPIVVTTEPSLHQIVEKGDFVNLTVFGTTDPDLTLKYRWIYNNVTYDDDSLPPFVTYNETVNTKEWYINTSALTDEEFKSINGTYYRELYHTYEVKTVPIEVIIHIPGPAPIVAGATVNLWWIPIVVALLVIIILVIIIACVVCYARERGTYPLDKKERGSDMDPEKDLAAGGFQELSRQPDDDAYSGMKSPLVNPNFDYEDDDDINPDDDDADLDVYAGEASDFQRFNEDGSFIGQYGQKKKQSETQA